MNQNDPATLDYARPADPAWEPAHWSTVVLGTILGLLAAIALGFWVVCFIVSR